MPRELKITRKWLQEKNACTEGYRWFLSQHTNNGINILERLITQDHENWANWLIVRMMSREQRINYAVFAAEQVLGQFENKHPNDKRPRKAIEAARRCIMDDSSAADAAYAAAKKKMQQKILNYGISLLKEVK